MANYKLSRSWGGSSDLHMFMPVAQQSAMQPAPPPDAPAPTVQLSGGLLAVACAAVVAAEASTAKVTRRRLLFPWRRTREGA